MANDDLSGIFDDLDPHDFATPIELSPTSAVEQTTNPDGTWAGASGFDLFVRACTKQLALAFSTSGGEPIPYAVLCSPRLERRFLTFENGVENYEQFYRRLHGEAQIMNAHWMFTFFKMPISVVEVELPVGTDIGDDNIEITEEVMDRARTIARNSVIWLAESIDPANTTKQRGLFRINGLDLEHEEITHVSHPTPCDWVFHPEKKLR